MLKNKINDLLKSSQGQSIEYEVLKYISNKYDNNDDTLCHIKDILIYGCQSGAVSSMIYYSDTLPFFDKHKVEIQQMLRDYEITPSDLRGFDNDDLLCLETNNQNLLAWFGFETALYDIATKLDIKL